MVRNSQSGFARWIVLIICVALAALTYHLLTVDMNNAKPRKMSWSRWWWWNPQALLGTEGYANSVTAPWNSLGADASRLLRYDLKLRTWNIVANSNARIGHGPPNLGPCDPPWDICGQYFAAYPPEPLNPNDPDYYPPYDDVDLRIYRLPDFEVVASIEGAFAEVRVSPDGQRMAAVEYLGSIAEYSSRSDNSTVATGQKGRIRVFNVPSALRLDTLEVFACPWGLAWSPDGRSLAFSTFEDRSIFTMQEDLHMDRERASYGIVEDAMKKSDRVICVLDIESESTTDLCPGTYPDWSPDGTRILFRGLDGSPWVYELTSGTTSRIARMPSGSNRYRWMGDTQHIAAFYDPVGRPVGEGLVVIIDIVTGAKYALPDNVYRDVRWSM